MGTAHSTPHKPAQSSQSIPSRDTDTVISMFQPPSLRGPPGGPPLDAIDLLSTESKLSKSSVPYKSEEPGNKKTTASQRKEHDWEKTYPEAVASDLVRPVNNTA